MSRPSPHHLTRPLTLCLLAMLLAMTPLASAQDRVERVSDKTLRGDPAAIVYDVGLEGEQAIHARQVLREYFAAMRAWRASKERQAAGLRAELVEALRLDRPAREIAPLRDELAALQAEREILERQAREAVMVLLEPAQRRAWEEAKLWAVVSPWVEGMSLDPVQAEAINRTLRDEAATLAKIQDSTGEPLAAAADRVLRFADFAATMLQPQQPPVVIIENDVRVGVRVETDRSRPYRPRPRSRPDSDDGSRPGDKPRPPKGDTPETKPLPPVKSAPLGPAPASETEDDHAGSS